MPGSARPDPAARGKPSSDTGSVFRDLLSTHESAPRPALPPTAPSPGRLISAAPADPLESAGQRSLFGEILDWMLAPLLLLWPISIAATNHVADRKSVV